MANTLTVINLTPHLKPGCPGWCVVRTYSDKSWSVLNQFHTQAEAEQAMAAFIKWGNSNGR